MPRVTHHHSTNGYENPSETIALKGRETNLFKLLGFVYRKNGVTAQAVGQFLGTDHPNQAITRGSNRLRSLINDGLVSRGALVGGPREQDRHYQYHITEKGMGTLNAKHVHADEKVLTDLANRSSAAL